MSPSVLYFTHTTLHVFLLQFDCCQLSRLQLQLFLAETERMEGRGSGVGKGGNIIQLLWEENSPCDWLL